MEKLLNTKEYHKMAKKTKFELSINHLKFVEHFCEYGNATQAYLYSFPNVNYNTARTEGNKLLTNPDISILITQEKEKLSVQFGLTKDRKVRELTLALERAEKAEQWGAYTKLQDMLIKLGGLYEAQKHEITGNIDIIELIEVKKEKPLTND